MLEPVFEVQPVEPTPEPDADNRARVSSTHGPAPVAIDDIERATSPDIHTVRTVLIEFDLADLTERRGAQHVSPLTVPSAEASGSGPIADNRFKH